MTAMSVSLGREYFGEKKIRLGMVGGGVGAFIGPVHRSAMRLDNRYELVAGAFSNVKSENAGTAEMLGIDSSRNYDSYEEMAKREASRSDGIEAVTVVTPNFLHAPVAKAFLENGIHVICDKPLTTTLADARELRDIANSKKLRLCVTHNYTGYPMIRQARELVRSGALGKIRSLRVTYPQQWLCNPLEKEGNRQAEWRTDPKLSGAAGCLGDIGSHAFSLADFIVGLDIESICADILNFVPGRKVDDHAQLMIRYKGGARGMIWASQVAPGEDQNLSISIYGETASLHWEHDNANELAYWRLGEARQTLVRGGNGLQASIALSSRLPAGLPEGYFECFANIYSDFAQMMRTDGIDHAHVPDANDGVRVLEFVEAALASSQTGSSWFPVSKLA